MKKKVIKGPHDWPEYAINDLVRVAEDVEAIVDGENGIVVMNVLINLLLQTWIKQDKLKDDLMKTLNEAYDMILKQKKAGNENKCA